MADGSRTPEQEQARGALRAAALLYVERLEDERDELAEKVKRAEARLLIAEEQRDELHFKVQAAESALHQLQADGGDLATQLTREVSRSVDLKRAAQSALTNLRAGSSGLGGIPASTGASVLRILEGAVKSWERAS